MFEDLEISRKQAWLEAHPLRRATVLAVKKASRDLELATTGQDRQTCQIKLDQCWATMRAVERALRRRWDALYRRDAFPRAS